MAPVIPTELGYRLLTASDLFGLGLVVGARDEIAGFVETPNWQYSESGRRQLYQRAFTPTALGASFVSATAFPDIRVQKTDRQDMWFSSYGLNVAVTCALYTTAGVLIQSTTNTHTSPLGLLESQLTNIAQTDMLARITLQQNGGASTLLYCRLLEQEMPVGDLPT